MVISDQANEHPNRAITIRMRRPQPWSQRDATDYIREIAKSDDLSPIITTHAREQMATRDLLMGDVLYVLKNGFVHAEAQISTQAGLYKYLVESRSPNSNNRVVRVVAIPDTKGCRIKIITVMWVDE